MNDVFELRCVRIVRMQHLFGAPGAKPSASQQSVESPRLLRATPVSQLFILGKLLAIGVCSELWRRQRRP